MKKSILIISNQLPGKYKQNLSPFVIDQAKSIERLGYKVTVIDCNPTNRTFLLALIYFMATLRKQLNKEKADIIHIQSGGVWGFCTSILSFSLPKVITFHGSDLLFGKEILFGIKKNQLKFAYILKGLIIKIFSVITIPFVNFVILVNDTQVKKMLFKKNYKVIPCGVDTNLFKPYDRLECKKKINLDQNIHYILFINPKRTIKNVNLAIRVIEEVKKVISNVEFLFAENIPNSEMPIYYNATDLLLITSISEGSPVMVKEGLACNTPIVSVNVGDISKTLENVENCYVCPFDKYSLSGKIISVLKNKSIVNTRRISEKFSLENIAKEVQSIYSIVAEKHAIY